jgi:chaperonin GroEL
MPGKLCFVLMPFKPQYLQVYKLLIKPTVEGLGFTCVRGDDMKTQRNIMRDIIEYISKADVIIADLTDMNPNVFYELGVTHALAKQTIMITQSIKKYVPFDLRPYRIIEYRKDIEGSQRLKEGIRETIQEMLESELPVSNPVQDFLPRKGKAFDPKALQQEVVRLRRELSQYSSAGASGVNVIRRHLLVGIDRVAEAARGSIGPRGHPMMISTSKEGLPLFTTDVLKIPTDIEVGNNASNVGARLVLEMAKRQYEEVGGGGVKTAIILVQELFRQGVRQIVEKGVSFMALKAGMQHVLDRLLAALGSLSKPYGLEDLGRHRTPESRLLAEAMRRVGKDGVILIDKGDSLDTHLEFVEGVHFAQGFLSYYMVTDEERKLALLDEPHVLLTDEAFKASAELMPILEKVVSTGRPLLIIAADVAGDALSMVIINKIRGNLLAVAVYAPQTADNRAKLFKEIATRTGAKVVGPKSGVPLKDITLDHLGKARKVVVSARETTILTQGVAGLPNRRQGLPARRKGQKDRPAKPRRADAGEPSRLIAVIRVGGASAVELAQRWLAVGSALATAKAALADGVVPGGGVALLRAGAALESLDLPGDTAVAREVMREALIEPFCQIIRNAGLDPGAILDRVRELDRYQGFDVERREFTDLVQAGIVEPTRSVSAALRNAVGLAMQTLAGQLLEVKGAAPPTPGGWPASEYADDDGHAEGEGSAS